VPVRYQPSGSDGSDVGGRVVVVVVVVVVVGGGPTTSNHTVLPERTELPGAGLWATIWSGTAPVTLVSICWGTSPALRRRALAAAGLRPDRTGTLV
jgi:hypothetical protein